LAQCVLKEETMTTTIPTLAGTPPTPMSPVETSKPKDPSRLLWIAMGMMGLAVFLRTGELIADIVSAASLYARH
jgi:hypothetical protein